MKQKSLYHKENVRLWFARLFLFVIVVMTITAERREGSESNGVLRSAFMSVFFPSGDSQPSGDYTRVWVRVQGSLGFGYEFSKLGITGRDTIQSVIRISSASIPNFQNYKNFGNELLNLHTPAPDNRRIAV